MVKKALRIIPSQDLPLEVIENNGLYRLSVVVKQEEQEPAPINVNISNKFVRVLVNNIPKAGKTITLTDKNIQPIAVFANDTNNNTYIISVGSIVIFEFSTKSYDFNGVIIPQGTPITISHKSNSLIDMAFTCKIVEIEQDIVL